MDSLGSRGQNKIYQTVKNNALTDTRVYTGGGTQPALQKILPKYIVGLLVAFFIFRAVAK